MKVASDEETGEEENRPAPFETKKVAAWPIRDNRRLQGGSA